MSQAACTLLMGQSGGVRLSVRMLCKLKLDNPDTSLPPFTCPQHDS